MVDPENDFFSDNDRYVAVVPAPSCGMYQSGLMVTGIGRIQPGCGESESPEYCDVSSLHNERAIGFDGSKYGLSRKKKEKIIRGQMLGTTAPKC